MPVTSIGSYGPTTLEFEIDWEHANSELGTTPLLLAGNYSLANFTADRTVMLTSIDNVTTLATTSRSSAAVRDVGKLDLLQRHKQFRGGVLGKITSAEYLNALPAAPKIGADQSKFTDPLKSAALLWTRINANATALGLDGPLTLAGGHTLAEFQADIVALGTVYDNAGRDAAAVGFARSERSKILSAIYARMKQFRQLVPSLLPTSSPARQNLPRLTPAPGTTPPRLAVNGEWDAATTQAHLTWTASTAADASKLQVRGCTGSYKNDTEEVVADLAADATHWEGNWGLTAPGATASFKVYVMTTTGNENGGKAVKIVRPTT